MANSVDPDQTAPIGAVCSGSTLFASILNLSVMSGNYLQQTTSLSRRHFQMHFFVALKGITRKSTLHNDFFNFLQKSQMYFNKPMTEKTNCLKINNKQSDPMN